MPGTHWNVSVHKSWFKFPLKEVSLFKSVDFFASKERTESLKSLECCLWAINIEFKEYDSCFRDKDGKEEIKAFYSQSKWNWNKRSREATRSSDSSIIGASNDNDKESVIQYNATT